VKLTRGPFVLTLIDDPTYTTNSVDNAHKYDREYCFEKEYQPSSKYGLFCHGPVGTTRSCILLAGGGGTRVHVHSVVAVNCSCFVGVGDMLCSMWVMCCPISSPMRHTTGGRLCWRLGNSAIGSPLKSETESGSGRSGLRKPTAKCWLSFLNGHMF
jgi:hypothetical protein